MTQKKEFNLDLHFKIAILNKPSLSTPTTSAITLTKFQVPVDEIQRFLPTQAIPLKIKTLKERNQTLAQQSHNKR